MSGDTRSRGDGGDKDDATSDVTSLSGRGELDTPSKPLDPAVNDDWLAFATEDPAFFIKPSGRE